MTMIERDRTREIDPAKVEIDWQGNGTLGRKGVTVRLPATLTLDDFGNDPTIWRRVQEGKTYQPFHHLDQITAIAADETWMATSTVKSADGKSATLSKPDVVKLDGHPAVDWQDENYEVRWDGDRFSAFRKSDDRRMPYHGATAEVAKMEVLKSYPKVA